MIIVSSRPNGHWGTCNDCRENPSFFALLKTFLHGRASNIGKARKKILQARRKSSGKKNLPFPSFAICFLTSKWVGAHWFIEFDREPLKLMEWLRDVVGFFYGLFFFQEKVSVFVLCARKVKWFSSGIFWVFLISSQLFQIGKIYFIFYSLCNINIF